MTDSLWLKIESGSTVANQGARNLEGIGPAHLKTSKKNNINATIRMEHVTEHPFRAKRRKLDEDSQENSEATIKNPSQLRNLLVFQQNAPAAKQGKLSLNGLQPLKLTKMGKE